MAHCGSTVPYIRLPIEDCAKSHHNLLPPQGFGIDSERLSLIANEIAKAADKVDLAVVVVVGGGNIVRGGTLAQQGQIAQATADYMGMLGTVLNGLALREALEQIGHRHD